MKTGNENRPDPSRCLCTCLVSVGLSLLVHRAPLRPVLNVQCGVLCETYAPGLKLEAGADV